MTLQELIARFRVLAHDQADPPFWSSEDIARWLSDGQTQACIRGRLLREDARDAICRIALVPGQHTYKLHRTVYEIIDVRIKPIVGPSRPLKTVTREWLDAEMPQWRDCNRPAQFAIQDENSLRLVGNIDDGDVLHLECYRLPMAALEDDSDEPEIHAAHHEHLIEWALFKAYSVPDADAFDPTRAKMAEDAFTRYFGLQPDSDMRRATRQDVQHYIRAILP